MPKKRVTYQKIMYSAVVCSECARSMTLLCRKVGVSGPEFHICWSCHKIWELDRGEVKSTVEKLNALQSKRNQESERC
jgi:Zn-finger nucleic acid-binding protein